MALLSTARLNKVGITSVEAIRECEGEGEGVDEIKKEIIPSYLRISFRTLLTSSSSGFEVNSASNTVEVKG